MSWFHDLTGLDVECREIVHANFEHSPPFFVSKANGRKIRHGNLAIFTLDQLRESSNSSRLYAHTNTLAEVVADVRELHNDLANRGAMFQVASQFNLLEMPNHNVSPEDGISNYQHDHTQGPACAIACGAGTIYRNYFHNLDGQLGQTWDRQIDCLKGLGDLLGNKNGRLWRMVNGYALPTKSGLEEINRKLSHASEREIERLKGSLQIGIQWFAEVTTAKQPHLGSQAYCSALPVSEMDHPPELWEPFARLVLEAAYEATLCAAVVNVYNGSRRVYLTLLGGGAFGNRKEWILESLARALEKCPPSGLDVRIVSYRRSDLSVKALANSIKSDQAISASSQ